MLEIVRETDVFQRVFKSLMKIVMMMPPNFWAEGVGTVVGYLIPEVLITIILTILGAMCAAVGASALAARVARVLSTMKKALVGIKNIGPIFNTFFSKLDDIANLVGKLAKALRRKRQEIVEGATDRWNRIVRRSRRLVSRAHAERVLRESETRELRRFEELSNNGRGRYGPAHATVVDRGNLGPNGEPLVFSGRNIGDRFNPDNLHPTLKNRYDAYLRDGEAMGQRRTFNNGTPVDSRPGHHAEIQAVNDALKARRAAGLPDDDAALEEMLISVRRVERQPGQSGKQFGCCNDCRRILTGEGGPTSVDFAESQRVQNARPEGER